MYDNVWSYWHIVLYIWHVYMNIFTQINHIYFLEVERPTRQRPDATGNTSDELQSRLAATATLFPSRRASRRCELWGLNLFKKVSRMGKVFICFHQRKVLQCIVMLSRLAFAQGASINAFDESGWTALHYSPCPSIFFRQRDDGFISFLLTCSFISFQCTGCIWQS